MKSKKFFLKKVLFFLLISFATVSPGLLKDTAVRTGTNLDDIKVVQDLKVGDTVLSFKENSGGKLEFINIPIKAISIKRFSCKSKNHNLVLIDTVLNGSDVGQLLVDSNTLFHNPKTNEWIKASDLKLEDKLLDVNSNQITINKIHKENLEADIEVYELSLQEPHYYFICDSAARSILVHNEVAMGTIALTCAAVPEAAPFVVAAGVGYGTCQIFKGIKSFFHHRRMKKQLCVMKQQQVAETAFSSPTQPLQNNNEEEVFTRIVVCNQEINSDESENKEETNKNLNDNSSENNNSVTPKPPKKPDNSNKDNSDKVENGSTCKIN